MQWIKSEDQLPKYSNRCLGYCHIHMNNDVYAWQGIVDVYFNPTTGWNRCENQDTKPVKVYYWCEYPEIPTE